LEGNKDRALLDGERAVELLRDADAFNERGNAYFARGDYRQAVHDYTTAIKLRPEDVILRMNRVRALVGRKDAEGAVKELAEVLKYDANNAALWYTRGVAQEERGEVDLAQGDYAKAAALGLDEAKKLATFTTRFVRVQNTTQEPIKVFAVYQTRSKGGWVQVP